MSFLSLIGLMRLSEHDAVKPQAEADAQDLRRMTVDRDDWKASSARWKGRFMNAISDLATAREEIAALRPDAEKHRAKLDRDRNRVRPSRAKAPTKGASK